MSGIAIFAYGSLLSRRSFAQTFEREPEEIIPSRLNGWRRTWSVLRDNLAAEKTFARSSGELPRWILGLNVERADAGGTPTPNGALIAISDRELERLDVRELRYDRVQVDGEVDGGDDFDRVFAYTARRDHFTSRPPEDAVAMASYLRAIEAAFRELGDGEWELFLQTTGPPPVETIEPVLVRDQIPPGNPRDW